MTYFAGSISSNQQADTLKTARQGQMNRVFPLFVLLVLVANMRCFAQTLPPHTIWGNSAGNAASATALPSQTINVIAFGADPTGANDSHAAIQSAINAAYAHNSGSNSGGQAPAIVYLPLGTYKLSQPLELNYPGLILEGDGDWGTFLAPQGRAIDLLTAGPNRGAASVFVRDLGILATNATEPSYGLIYINNVYDSGLENITIGNVSNSVANAIYIANSGGMNIKNVQVHTATSAVTTTGILVTTNSQVSLDNVDVEGFNGTNGKGIATSGALVNLDIISSHVEGDYYGYYHGASYGQTTSGRTNIYGGTFIYGAGPAAIEVMSDNLAVYGTGIFYGGVAFDIPLPPSGGAFKNIVVDTQPPSTGKLFTSTSDLSGVHLRNQKLATGGEGVLAINRLDFSRQYVATGTPIQLFSMYNFSPGTFRLYLTSDSYGQAATAYQVDFTVVNNQASAPIVRTLGQVAGSNPTTAGFAVIPTGSNGVTLTVTPTASGGTSPTVSGYLEYYGVDYFGTQSVVAGYCNPTGTGC
jgi:Pectate lyase superfamily protein